MYYVSVLPPSIYGFVKSVWYLRGGILGTLHAMFMLKTIGAVIKIAKATTNN